MRQQYLLIIFITLFTFGVSFQSTAGNDKNALGARAAALGTASVTFSDVYAVFANQAGLANLSGLSASLYAENRFLIKDINLFAAAFALPTKSGTFGLGATYFGNSLYNESQIRLAYGRKLSEKLALGVEFDFVSLSISEYGSKSALTFGLGLQYKISDEFKVGGHVYNPLRVTLADSPFPDAEDDKLPMIIKFGMAYSPSDKVTVLGETEKSLDQDPIFKVGIEYQLIDKLYLRAGVSNSPTNATFGMGVNLGALKIDFASSFHPDLGYTPSVSINFVGKKKEKIEVTE